MNAPVCREHPLFATRSLPQLPGAMSRHWPGLPRPALNWILAVGQAARVCEGSVRWRALSRLLPLGCAASHGELTLPWFFAQDLGDLDPFNVLLATGAKVAVYPRARASVKPVGQLAWQLVKPLASFDQTQAFQQVQLVGGALTGYIATAQLRSPVDYRLTATRTSGNWRITSFIAGD
jgi:hypothetical protein